jgi:hypothetical protein
MDKKKKYKILMLFGIALILLSSVLILLVNMFSAGEDNPIEESSTKEGLMLLIEFEDTAGLENFVSEMHDRDIPGLLVVSYEFAEEHADVLKELNKYGIEIGGTYSVVPLWDVSYEEQLSIMTTVKERIESALGTEMRVFGSKYFAYDENTLKAAQELGIEYVLARGTTGAKATIYKPDEYDVKIFSVSNVNSEKWGTGSLCDYSYWAREGTPEEFSEELFGAYNTYDKISPVSHTYIGGLKQRWFDVYMNFFDSTDIEWLDLDSFGQVDVYASMEDIPVNREVQYTTPKPAVALEDEVNVNNPCAVEVNEDDIKNTEKSSNDEEDLDIVMFHNGVGEMCLDAIDFFRENNIEYTEYLTTDENFNTKLSEYKEKADYVSSGVSTTFGYYPMIFIGDKAFSGFNDEIEKEILETI